jgi:tetratricopeptide (TPR) repeat protein
MTDPVSARYKDALQRGHVAVVKGRPREAIGHYEEAASLVPERPLPYTLSGQIYLQMEEPREAVAAFEAALERTPSDTAALQGKAAALAALGRREEAGVIQARATELEAREHARPGRKRAADPRLVEIERHVINAAAARAAGDLGVASAAYLTAANGYLAINDFDAAIDACLRGLEARPGNIDIHFVMTVLYLRRGWIALAVQRATLIEHRLGIDDDRRRRNALGALARDFRTLSPELERLATSTS